MRLPLCLFQLISNSGDSGDGCRAEYGVLLHHGGGAACTGTGDPGGTEGHVGHGSLGMEDSPKE